MKITKLDLWIYKLFYWRWNKILKAKPDMLNWFIQYMVNYQKSINKKEKKCLPTYLITDCGLTCLRKGN